MKSNNRNYYIFGVTALVIIAGVVYLLSSSKKDGMWTAVNTAVTTLIAENQTTATIMYTNRGFSPTTLEVPVGTKVIFTNQGDGLMWVASAHHPTHQLLPGFDSFKGVPNGASYEYTFTKAGVWKYHDHLNASSRGLVIVK